MILKEASDDKETTARILHVTNRSVSAVIEREEETFLVPSKSRDTVSMIETPVLVKKSTSRNIQIDSRISLRQQNRCVAVRKIMFVMSGRPSCIMVTYASRSVPTLANGWQVMLPATPYLSMFCNKNNDHSSYSVSQVLSISSISYYTSRHQTVSDKTIETKPSNK